MEKTKYEISTAMVTRFEKRIDEQRGQMFSLDLDFILQFLNDENVARPRYRISSLIRELARTNPALACSIGAVVAHEYSELSQKWGALVSAFSPVVETEIQWQVDEGMLQRKPKED